MARTTVLVAKPEAAAADALVVPWFKGDSGPAEPGGALDRKLGGDLSGLVRLGDFQGKPREARFLPTRGRLGAPRVLLLGLGPKKALTVDALREAGAKAAVVAREARLKVLAMPLVRFASGAAGAHEAARALAEGAGLGLFEFKEYKSEKPVHDEEEPVRTELAELRLLVRDEAEARPARRGAEEGVALAESTNLARRLIMRPSLAKPPPALAKLAAEEARKWGIRAEVWTKKDLERKGMGGILGVAAGSVHEPRLVVLESRPRARRTVLLVGKGITFDSGGINIKPSDGLDRMRYDMAGSATVLAATIAAVRLKLPHRVVALLPLAENMPSGSALHPGDILKTYDGTTIEVGNTDAEGRLVLADALSYGVEKYRPDFVVDVATLTGAVRVALGAITTGVLGNDDALVRRLIEAGQRTGDDLWQLPLHREYEKQVESDVADLKNVGPGHGGAIIGAAFLKHFVGKTPWAHLDIAGTCWTERGPGDLKKEYLPKGATGIGVRLLTEFLRSLK